MIDDPAFTVLVYESVFRATRAVMELLTSFHRDDSIYNWPYLVSALALALVGHILLRRTGGMLRDSLSWRVLWHRSSRADYRWFVVNTIVFASLIAPMLMGSAAVAESFNTALAAIFGPATTGSAAVTAWRVTYTLCFFVAFDFGRFLAHWLQHEVPVLWQFHKVHHSAECLTIITSSRAHPVDLVMMATGGALFGGLVTGLFLYAAGPEVITPYTFLGQHVLIAVYNAIGSLRHTHVWLGYGRLEAIFVSPAMHQIHHSARPEHWNKNNGFALAIWDRLFGAWVPSRDVAPFPMGLGDGTDGQWHSVWRMYVWPCRDALALLTGRNKAPTTSDPA